MDEPGRNGYQCGRRRLFRYGNLPILTNRNSLCAYVFHGSRRRICTHYLWQLHIRQSAYPLETGERIVKERFDWFLASTKHEHRTVKPFRAASRFPFVKEYRHPSIAYRGVKPSKSFCRHLIFRIHPCCWKSLDPEVVRERFSEGVLRSSDKRNTGARGIDSSSS